MLARLRPVHVVAAIAVAGAVACAGATTTDTDSAAAPQAVAEVPKATGAGCNARRRGGFVGLGGGDSLNNPADRDCVLGLQAMAGAGYLRQAFYWSDIETSPGVYDFSQYDFWMRSVAKHRMRVLPILFKAPPFHGRQSSRDVYPPSDLGAFGRFAAAAVRRYGLKGTFFRENPGVPRVPIRSWQIWNEPNLRQYWLPRPNARAYVKMLRAVYKAIKKVNRRAEVVTAGIPATLLSDAIRFDKFVKAMYRAKGARYFDTLAYNGYGKTAGDVIRSMGAVRKLMNRNRDRKGNIWITEVGWGTGGPSHRYNIGERRQAREIPKLLRGLYRARRRLRLRGVSYFTWQDKPPYSETDEWGLHTGLFRLDGQPKPGYRAFKRVAPKLR